jgi:hypothetical protein
MKVNLQIAISDHEIVRSEVNLLEWATKYMLSEMYRRWPVKNETARVWRNQLYQEVIRVEADWKEPVQ